MALEIERARCLGSSRGHCVHAFDGATGLYFCCHEGCKDVVFAGGLDIEEKTHGGLIFTPGQRPRVNFRGPLAAAAEADPAPRLWKPAP